MIFRQHQLPCLSLFSYLIGDETTGRAVVVDPQRDISEYRAEADALGLRIERVIETHFHADFPSGHLELAAATGAAAVESTIIDVRNPSEQNAGTIDGAISIPLPTLPGRVADLDPTRPTVVYCASGARSSIAASLLRTKGVTDVVDILGGFDACRATRVATT